MDIFAIVNFGGEVFMFSWNFKKKEKAGCRTSFACVNIPVRSSK